jgi:hypothetical protein
MLLGEEELEAQLEAGMPRLFHDPCLKHSRAKYLGFVCELYKSGIVKFSEEVKVEVGCFFVSKKSGMLRLILDARRSNAHFRRPPSRNNCSSASFGNLRVPEGQQLWLSQYDVKDFSIALGFLGVWPSISASPRSAGLIWSRHSEPML